MFDLTNVEASKSFENLPNGKYHVMADKAEVKPTKSGGEFINLEVVVQSGEFKGRKLWAKFNIKNESEKAVQIGLGQLKQFMTAAGAKSMVIKDLMELSGLEAIANVTTDEYGNKIKSFEALPTSAPKSEVPW